ncbi:hypothetical protein OH76DRAFT_1483020 [Lentinus brumalis]|uniref:Uncharacterized protein n=1 Tax=Lentinus brumalis TaxID=2498619 RepID=A0A371DAU9_9APHY|nr:hypothetical protein OH76DRAFT_1483020 [Polyporus brumalis]
MNTGETEVRLSDRPPIYTALGGLRPCECRLWDFTTSTWMAQDFDAVFSVSEFDQHTLLIRLPEVTRCLEFGKAIAYAEEPLWPALAEQGGQEDEITSEQDNKHASDIQVSTAIATSRQGSPTAGTSQQVQERPKSIKKSRKGKEVVRG